MQTPKPQRNSPQTLSPGEPFRPKLMFNGAFVPVSVLESELSPPAKLLLGRLFLYAGDQDHCNPSFQEIMRALRFSKDMVSRSLRELEEARLIKTVRHARREAERYFIWNPVLAGSLRNPGIHEFANTGIHEGQDEFANTGIHGEAMNSQNPVDEFAKRALVNSQNPEFSYKEEKIQGKESGKESSSSSDVSVESAGDDDDFSNSQSLKPSKVWWTSADLPELIKAIRDARSRGLSENEAFGDPENQDAIRILRVFDDREHFEAWAEKFDRAGKSSVPTAIYSYMASDARLSRNQALADREKNRRVRAAKQAEDRRRTDEVPIEQAVKVIREIWYEHVIEAIQERCKRTAEKISPKELRDVNRKQSACPSCKGVGFTGGALDRTLRFCDCEAGHIDRETLGEDYLDQQIEQTNATLRSRLTEALTERGLLFVRNTFEDCQLTENSDTVTLSIRGLESQFAVQDLRRYLPEMFKRIGERRQLQIKTSDQEIRRAS